MNKYILEGWVWNTPPALCDKKTVQLCNKLCAILTMLYNMIPLLDNEVILQIDSNSNY